MPPRPSATAPSPWPMSTSTPCSSPCPTRPTCWRPTTVTKRMVGGVVSRIKIMADLDISERRIPQDGRVGLTVEGRQIDVRVVTVPSVHGESVVLRILDKNKLSFELDKLGMQEHEI